jgi:hypothetical protein
LIFLKDYNQCIDKACFDTALSRSAYDSAYEVFEFLLSHERGGEISDDTLKQAFTYALMSRDIEL